MLVMSLGAWTGLVLLCVGDLGQLTEPLDILI